jgi:hypothetical protein
MARYNTGRAAYVEQGIYSPFVVYNEKDVVFYNNGSYVYTGEVSSAGNLPTDTAYWSPLLDPSAMNSATDAANQAASNAENAADAAYQAASGVEESIRAADEAAEEANAAAIAANEGASRVNAAVDQAEGIAQSAADAAVLRIDQSAVLAEAAAA